MKHGDPPYIPTPSELRARILAVRNGWTETEERRRRTVSPAEPLRFDPILDNVFGKAVWSEART